MSARNIFVGFPDGDVPKSHTPQKGRAHIDIFSSVPPTITPKKVNASKSSIQDILTQETDKVETNGNPQPKEDKTENNNTTAKATFPTRVRMPPGGHSCGGFW